MKIFEKDSKINFVDDNNVLVGFDYHQSCCENFGWMVTQAKPKQDDQEHEKNEGSDGFNFDTDFMDISSDSDGGGQVSFRLIGAGGERFLTLWNHHNGYYSHGFEMEQDGKNIHEDVL